MCIRCLERLYAVHGVEIGAFPDVMILIRSMASTRNIETQHRLLGLLATILGVQHDNGKDEDHVNVPENAEQLLNMESIVILCQFVAWGHINGVQATNLMTSLLDSANPKGALLKDGNQTQPDGYVNVLPSKSTAFTSSAGCPPVWFIATTHRKPPPSETIRGPFRISDLKNMTISGEISPFTLVTSTHVENYEEEDGTNSTELMQIDTGKWRCLDEIWQLRWQLCINGNETGVYPSSEVALRALLSLTRLVDLHRSLDSRGLPYYPIPIAKRIICGLSKDPFSPVGEATDNRLSFLSVLAQSILCNDHNVVDQAANLLFKLTQYNEEATSKIYLTGVYFFIACYTGSNFLALAKLTHATHLDQHFRSGYAAAADNDELSTKDRSVMGGLLPEGLLYILVNYGIEKFNDVFVGCSDNPEVIWDLDMRKHLIEMVRQHLGDFPKRLWQNTTTQYEYCPMPSVAYKRLEKEVFCHNYYLRNLCDETRFPNYPIKAPVEVFRSCLEEFKKQMNRNESDEDEALQEANKILNLKPGDASKDLRKAYRNLARKYHPDKNPAGREMFEAIQRAYDLLLPIIDNEQEMRIFDVTGVEDDNGKEGNTPGKCSNSAEGFLGGSSQMETLRLLMKTQILICKRFETDIGKYKYPAYQLLLSCLKLTSSCRESREKDDHRDIILSSSFCTKRRASFIRDSVELIFRTCLVSPMNAEELISESGITVLYSIFGFYIHAGRILEKRTATDSEKVSNEVLHEIISLVVHTIAGVAYYKSGRCAIESLPNLSEFCLNWRRCVDGNYLTMTKQANDSSLKRFAVEGVANMARSRILQNALVGSGILWPLGRFLLGFDPTLDESSTLRDNTDDDVGVSQASCNTLARLSARALGMLSGLLQDPKLASPRNIEVQEAMNTILTSPVSLLLRNKRTSEILRTLNTNIESPAKIWNLEMRSEMMSLLSTMEANRPEDKVQTLSQELDVLSGFEYRALNDELQIGGIYVRVFNKIGLENGNLRDVIDPCFFAKELISYIARCINNCDDLPEGWIRLDVSEINVGAVITSDTVLRNVPITDRRFIMVISALRLLIRADSPIDDSLYVPSVLISLIELPQDSEAFEIGSECLSILTSKQGFVNAVAEQGTLWRLLWILQRKDGPDNASSDSQGQNDILKKHRGWGFFESLSSSPSISKKILESSAWLELLGILVGYSEFTKVWTARSGAAKILSRLLWDPQTGQTLAPLLGRFLPTSLIAVLKEEGPDTMLNLFDGESDTPELIWDSAMRGELRKVAGMELDLCMKFRRENGTGNDSFNLEPKVRVKYSNLENEIFIGGVYVTRFLKEPTFNIRDPTSFLEMLLQRWTHELQMCTDNESNVEEKYSTDIVISGQDNLQPITDAIVYLCKIRTNLCDKLTQWGYMSRCLYFFEDILRCDLIGSPLLSVMRILHVAVNRRVNVESLIASGTNDRLHGIIAFTMKAVGNTNLHPDAGFMLEMLKKIFVDALGDVQKASQLQSGIALQMSYTSSVKDYAMAPSPAPGENPVSRNRVRVNMGDDPLGLGAGIAPDPVPVSSQERMSSMNTAQNYGQIQHMGATNAYCGIRGQANINQGSSQNNNIVGQQTQRAFNSQTMYGSSTFRNAPDQRYGGIQNPAEVHQYMQPTQTQPSNSIHNYVIGQQQQQQQQQQRPVVGSYSQHNIMAQQTYSSQGNQHQSSSQQYNGPNNLDSRNISYLSQGSQIPHFSQSPQPTFQGPQALAPAPAPAPALAPAPTHMTSQDLTTGGISSYTTQVPPYQPREVNYQPVSSATSYQQPKNNQIITNNMMQQSASHYSHQPKNSNPNPNPNPNQQHQSYQGFQQSPKQSTDAPVVETVDNDGLEINNANPTNAAAAAAPHHQNKNGHIFLTVNKESAIDARTQPELPSIQAARKAETTEGAPDSSQGRRVLLESALLCDLPNYLIDSVLENPNLSKVKDPASVKVHVVELLKLLTQDPGYGLKFQLIMDKIPNWKTYVSQDHSLFITGIEQKTDYFLTNGSSLKDSKKLYIEG